MFDKIFQWWGVGICTVYLLGSVILEYRACERKGGSLVVRSEGLVCKEAR